MLQANHLEVLKFCLEHAQNAPVWRRVRIYRGLAEICGNEPEAAALTKMADDLEQADKRCREFVFKFEEKTHQ
jgi:hypothetical protein